MRSTRPVTFTHCNFIGPSAFRNQRDPSHIEKYPNFPDPKVRLASLHPKPSVMGGGSEATDARTALQCFLTGTQKYFFRNAALRHLRVEQAGGSAEKPRG